MAQKPKAHMKIAPQRTGKSEFLAVYNRVLEDEMRIELGDPKRLYYLRCSQLPYCPRSVLLNFAIRGLYRPVSTMMAYYVGVGHAVHAVMQDYLSVSGQLLADYTCRLCHKRYPFSHRHECCGFPTRYDEVTIWYKGISGHIDAIFKDKQGRYWIVDFKTSSLAGAPVKEKKPGENYRQQIRSYAYLLWKQYGLKVAGVMLVFIPRDNPKKPSIWEQRLTDDDFEEIRQDIKHNRKLHKNTLIAETEGDYKRLAKHKCGGEYCDACKMDTAELIKQIMRNQKMFPIAKHKDKHLGKREKETA